MHWGTLVYKYLIVVVVVKYSFYIFSFLVFLKANIDLTNLLYLHLQQLHVIPIRTSTHTAFVPDAYGGHSFVIQY